MPLINLKTDLKSLRFGSADVPGDRPGGGWSKQPLIKGKDIDSISIEDLRNTGGADFILRGGYLTPIRALTDLSRLTQLFVSTNVGWQFTGKQEILSRIGTSLDGGYNPVVKGLFINPLNEGIYNPLGTILQAGGTAFGTHLYKQGINPFTGGPKYMTLVAPLGAEEVGIKQNINNRLVRLYRNKIQSKSGSQDNILFEYKGGPGSILGIGDTTINRFVKTFGQYENFKLGGIRTNTYMFEVAPLGNEQIGIKNKIFNRLILFSKNKLGSNDTILYTYNGGEGVGEVKVKITSPTITSGKKPLDSDGSNYSTLSYDQIKRSKVVGSSNSTLVTDFRRDLESKPKSFISDSPDYTEKNIEQRVNLGDPGKRGVDRSNYTRGIVDENNRPVPLDKTNALYLYKSENVTQDRRKNDLVKFRIAIIDNDNPKEKVFAHFRAFITSFSDSMGAVWDSFKYTGRGEDFYTYNGFNQSYSMGFEVVAQSIAELSIMYQKLNYIKSTLAPDYSTSGFMRGNIAQLTLGGYLYEVPGIITSFNITIPEDTTWEIGIPASPEQSTEAAGSNGFTDSSVKELPHRVSVSMDFKPIHKFLPQKVKDIYGGANINQRFISLEDADGTSSNNLYANGINDIFKAK